MSDKLWIGDKMYVVDEEVLEHVESLEAKVAKACDSIDDYQFIEKKLKRRIAELESLQSQLDAHRWINNKHGWECNNCSRNCVLYTDDKASPNAFGCVYSESMDHECWKPIILPDQESEKKQIKEALGREPVSFLPDCKWRFREDGVVYCRGPIDDIEKLYGKPCSKRCKSPEPPKPESEKKQ